MGAPARSAASISSCLGEAGTVVGGAKQWVRADGNDAVLVDGRVTALVVVPDVVHVDGVADAWHLVDFAHEIGDVGVLSDGLAVALEVRLRYSKV